MDVSGMIQQANADLHQIIQYVLKMPILLIVVKMDVNGIIQQANVYQNLNPNPNPIALNIHYYKLQYMLNQINFVI